MVKKYMHENLKHTLIKHLTKKTYLHFQTVTTNNSKHFFRFRIRQYWQFQGVTTKLYYTLFLSSYQTIPYSSADSWKPPIHISDWLILCFWNLETYQKRNKNDKNTNFYDEKQQQKYQKSVCKYIVAFFTLNSSHWPMM